MRKCVCLVFVIHCAMPVLNRTELLRHSKHLFRHGQAVAQQTKTRD